MNNYRGNDLFAYTNPVYNVNWLCLKVKSDDSK